MATPAQIEQQVNLEREQIKQGLKRLHKQTKDLENKSYASASVYGIASIDTLLPLLVERIEMPRYASVLTRKQSSFSTFILAHIKSKKSYKTHCKTVLF